MNRLVTLLLLLIVPLSSDALEVFACEPEWASLVKELAGENANRQLGFISLTSRDCLTA